jgi:hypothetical protein
MTDFHHSTARCRHVLPPHRLRLNKSAGDPKEHQLREAGDVMGYGKAPNLWDLSMI